MAISEGSWSKMVKLTSGGFVTIQITGHPLDMTEEDRTFVEQLVDRVKEYEDDAKKYAENAPGSARGGNVTTEAR